MWKVKVFTWRPILERASMRAGFEKVEGLKVVVIDRNSTGAVRVAKSWHTRRKLGRSSSSRWANKLSRHLSFSQKRKNDELVDKTKLQMEPMELSERAAGKVNTGYSRTHAQRDLTSTVDSRGRRQRNFAKQQPRACARGGGGETPIASVAVARRRALERRRGSWCMHWWVSST